MLPYTVTPELLTRIVYVIDARSKSIRTMTFMDYLYDYGIEEVTTPIGLQSRYFVQPISDPDDRDTILYYSIYAWGPHGGEAKPIGMEFDEEFDADMYLMSRYWRTAVEVNDDAPVLFFDLPSAESALSEL